MIQRMLLSPRPVRAGRWLPIFIILAIVAPSPALTAGSVLGFAAPGALAGIGVLATRRSRFIKSSSARAQQSRLQLPVLAGVLLVISSLADGEADSLQRAIGRSVAVFAFYSLAMLYTKSPDDRRQILRAVGAGALVSALIVIAASIRSRGFFGAEILPSRDFILPLGLPKTTGVPRSFGELGLILAGGLAAYQYLSTRRARTLGALVILAAFMVGQSRNMLVVLAAVLACLVIRRRVRRLAGLGGLIALVALLSPAVISVLIDQGAVAEQLVGEGIFERNVEARLNLATEVGAAIDQGWIFGRPFGATRAEWRTIASFAPHNHFVSLFVFDGYVGVLYIVAMYVSPVLRLGRRPNALNAPEFIWMAGAIVALSFYEGAFSASLVVALALIHSKTFSIGLDDNSANDTQRLRTPLEASTLR